MKKLIDITIVLDRSGSMESIVNETIIGYNNFLSSQRLIKGEACISLVQFDHEYNKVYTGLDIQKAPFLNRDTYVPRGLTALLDAVGLTIKSIRKRLKSNCNTRETRIIFVIITDGYENHSCHFSRKEIFNKISKLEAKEGWEFVFLGANQDSIREAGHLGIKDQNALNFIPVGNGVTEMFEAVSFCIAECREKDTDFRFKRNRETSGK